MKEGAGQKTIPSSQKSLSTKAFLSLLERMLPTQIEKLCAFINCVPDSKLLVIVTFRQNFRDSDIAVKCVPVTYVLF